MNTDAADRLTTLWSREAFEQKGLNLPLGLIGKVLELIPEPDHWMTSDDGRSVYILAGDALFLVTVNKNESPFVTRRELKGEHVIAGIEWGQSTTDEMGTAHWPTQWTFRFPDGERVTINGLVSMSSRMPVERLDTNEELARAIAGRIGWDASERLREISQPR